MLSLCETLLGTVGALLVSWLLQQFVDLISGYGMRFTLKDLTIITLILIAGIAFANLISYYSKPKFITQGMAQYKEYIFGELTRKNIAAFSGENVREEKEAEPIAFKENIRIKDLSFGYEPQNKVLHQINCTFESGKKYAVVGASGSGKSTLLNLLTASHSDYEGEIFYDQRELRNISSESLYEIVSVIQQNVFIFNASIRDNITMFADFPREEVNRAIALSGLSDLIAERGEDYLCGENGSGLSGGEKQRISIARSLLKKSRVLLVDEATAALDPLTAFQISNAILNMDNLTGIVITHALDGHLLKRYDGLLALKNGGIAEMGTFEELMAKKGYFYSLYTVAQ